MNPDLIMGSSLGLEVIMASGGGAGLSDTDGPINSMVSEFQPGPMWWFRSRVVMQFLMTAGTMELNTELPVAGSWI